MLTTYESELLYFENLYSKMSNFSESHLLKVYLFELLNFNTTNEIIAYYTATKQDNITLKSLEEEMLNFDDVYELKKVLVSCFIDELLKIYNRKMNFE